MCFLRYLRPILRGSRKTYCPFCAEVYGGPTVKTHSIILKNLQIGFYVKCETCKRTTPVGEDLEIVNSWWNEYFNRYYEYFVKTNLA